jgi:GNAT superfamily N-acetyltransferase
MNPTLRRGNVEDAKVCGAICYQAFKTIAEAHHFTPDFPSVDEPVELFTWMLGHASIYGVVAEIGGKVVGSNFLDERNCIAGVGPITVDPSVQNKMVGRQLMEDVHHRAAQKNLPGVRLIQAGYHMRSLSLYAKLGYDVREPLACLQGPAINAVMAGYGVRPATLGDCDACNRLCRQVHGHDRGGELLDAVQKGAATVVEHDGQMTGYATTLGFFGHAVGESNSELQALIGAAQTFAGPGFLLPIRNTELFRWCLQRGLRVTQPMTLMSLGLYNEPAGAFLPSVVY